MAILQEVPKSLDAYVAAKAEFHRTGGQASPFSFDDDDRLERAEAELELLGKAEIGAQVGDYMQVVIEWLKTEDVHDPSSSGLKEVQEELRRQQAEILSAMRKDLGVNK